MSGLDDVISRLAEQQRRRCDLEAKRTALERAVKSTEEELLSLQHKDELLNRQLPALKRDIAQHKVSVNIAQTNLDNQRKSQSNMQVTLASMKKKIEVLEHDLEDKKKETVKLVSAATSEREKAVTHYSSLRAEFK